jgi:hypothetical protein
MNPEKDMVTTAVDAWLGAEEEEEEEEEDVMLVIWPRLKAPAGWKR